MDFSSIFLSQGYSYLDRDKDCEAYEVLADKYQIIIA